MYFDKSDLENFNKFAKILNDKGVSYQCEGLEAQIRVSDLLRWYLSLGAKIKKALEPEEKKESIKKIESNLEKRKKV